MKFPRLFAIAILFALLLTLNLNAQQNYPERFLVKVFLDNEQDIQDFLKLPFDLATQRINEYAEVVAGPEELIRLAELGYRTEIVPDFNTDPEVIAYPSYEEVSSQLVTLAAAHPDIMRVYTLGYSQRRHLPIPVVKLSDNVMEEEDEPAVLFDALHHAREPVGMLCTLVTLNYLLNNYGLNYQVTDWIDNTEIFIVPMINPEGWQYLYDNNLSNPWWRKNLRENNGNTLFQPSVDGVDLNRNYNFNFMLGGSSNMESWTYRGPSPFSEPETLAKRDLTMQQKFVASITYHSYGEIILFPWNESPRPGDFELLQNMSRAMANKIRTVDGTNTYQPVKCGCQVGQSQCWMYGVGGVLEVLIETADVFIPDRATGDQVAWDNLDAALYMLDRVKGPGLKGIITDAVTGNPLEATVTIKEIDNGASRPRTSDPVFGRYYRLLDRGTYTLEVSLEGYQTSTVTNVEISAGPLQELNVQLNPGSTSRNDIYLGANSSKVIFYPNPIASEAHFQLDIKVPGHYQLSILNQLGQVIDNLLDTDLLIGQKELIWDTNKQGFPTGIYYFNLIGPHGIQTGKIIKK